jgi:hypothetical protein
MTPAPPRERLVYLSGRFHRLGERPVHEFIREVMSGADPVARLEAYARLHPDLVAALNSDRLSPHRVIKEGRDDAA